jgi:hypothetical protein
LPDHSLSTQEKDELTFAVLSDRSEADRTGSEQCHHRKAGATNGVIEADIGLYHPCGIEHCAGVFGSRRPSGSDPGSL